MLRRHPAEAAAAKLGIPKMLDFTESPVGHPAFSWWDITRHQFPLEDQRI
jgi:hypothetical protein